MLTGGSAASTLGAYVVKKNDDANPGD